MPSKDDIARPKPQQASRSFTRYEPLSTQPSGLLRLPQDATKPAASGDQVAAQDTPTGPERSHSDIFEQQDEADSPEEEDHNASGEESSQQSFEGLPIEIRSLVERFLESLPLKPQSSISLQHVEELYQSFYIHVQSHIATHIAAQQSKLSRERSPAASTSSISSANSRNSTRRALSSRKEPEHQMLTATEVSDRRKARKQLETRRLWMEEAVERRVCERAYRHIWRASSTDDESRDAKLKSRAAALSVVGVDLKELLSTSLSNEEKPTTDPTSSAETRQDPAHTYLSGARRCLQRMNELKHPQGKLQALSATHKEIVDALQELFPSSSSADEILPTLIYVVITSHPESINLVSDLLFVQRFRNTSKLGGEAAYCLTNLEAAIGFLETVDLSSIRSSEQPEGPSKGVSSESRPSTPQTESITQDPLYQGLPSSPPPLVPVGVPSPRHSRRLSSLIGGRPQPLPGAVITQADNAIDAIHTALDSSFQFLFGRIKEKQLAQTPGDLGNIVAPRTLEDARKLVTEKPDTDGLGDEESIHQGSHQDRFTRAKESDVLSLIGGRRVAREGGTGAAQRDDSVMAKSQSIASTSPTTIVKSDIATASGNVIPGTTSAAVASGLAAVESVRSFGDSLNPFKSFSMRNFGRPAGSLSPLPASPATLEQTNSDAESRAVNTQGTTDPPQAQAQGVDATGIGPPIDRFMDMRDARELNFFDVERLLRDYQRLAGALRMLQS